MSALGTTLSRYILQEERYRSEVAEDVLPLLAQIGYAAKILSREFGRAALVGKLGLVGDKNATGDAQKKMDVFGNETVVEAFVKTGLVAAIVSEEIDSIKQLTGGGQAKYVLCMDPVDGSSNTDINGAIGTIFGFYRRISRQGDDFAPDVLRKGSEQVLAGYVLYSTSTVLVYTSGHGVNGFTLDRDLGEFLLSHENIRCPAVGRYYSANLGNVHEWDPGIRKYIDYLTSPNSATRPYSLRYSGALVADVHRSLLEGGFYFYPADRSHPQGKLRLLYEGAPLALVVEQAGGRASTGKQRVLDIQAESIHQRLPLVIGSAEDVELYEKFLAA